MSEKINYDEKLKEIEALCRKNGIIPKNQELIQMGVLSDVRGLAKHLKNKSFNEWRDYFRSLGYSSSNTMKEDVKVGSVYVKMANLDLHGLTLLFKEFKAECGRFPNSEDCNNSKTNLPKWHILQNTLIEKFNMTINDFYSVIGNNKYLISTDDYDDIVKKYIETSNNIGHPLTNCELVNNEYGLPSSRWLVKYCPNKKVKNFNHFIEWCGLIPYYEISKSKATELILKKQRDLGRLLLTKDFCSPEQDEVGIGIIKNIWGSFNNMKMDLGLEITQEGMTTLSKPFDEMKKDLDSLCDNIYRAENRKTITTDDINNNPNTVTYGTYQRIFRKELGLTVRDYLQTIGFQLQDAGTGLNYMFLDGEETSSQYELFFSKYLRDAWGLTYNVDYFRNIKYKTFVDNYNRNMDCDYIIRKNDQLIYIEIAGMLRDYKQWYLDDKPIISSKSKEKYRLTLTKKEKMFVQSNLKYHILFPCDLNEEYLNGLFEEIT